MLPLTGFLTDGLAAAHAFAPRRLGADTDAILGELGYSVEEIAGFRAAGVI